MQTILVPPAGINSRPGWRPVIRWNDKASGATAGLQLDFSGILGSLTITGAAVEVAPFGTSLVATALTYTTTAVTVTLAGGSPDTPYALTFSVATSDGAIADYATQIYVNVLGPVSSLPASAYSLWINGGTGPIGPTGATGPAGTGASVDGMVSLAAGLIQTGDPAASGVAIGYPYLNGDFFCFRSV